MLMLWILGMAVQQPAQAATSVDISPQVLLDIAAAEAAREQAKGASSNSAEDAKKLSDTFSRIVENAKKMSDSSKDGKPDTIGARRLPCWSTSQPT